MSLPPCFSSAIFFCHAFHRNLNLSNLQLLMVYALRLRRQSVTYVRPNHFCIARFDFMYFTLALRTSDLDLRAFMILNISIIAVFALRSLEFLMHQSALLCFLAAMTFSCSVQAAAELSICISAVMRSVSTHFFAFSRQRSHTFLRMLALNPSKYL